MCDSCLATCFPPPARKSYSSTAPWSCVTLNTSLIVGCHFTDPTTSFVWKSQMIRSSPIEPTSQTLILPSNPPDKTLPSEQASSRIVFTCSTLLSRRSRRPNDPWRCASPSTSMTNTSFPHATATWSSLNHFMSATFLGTSCCPVTWSANLLLPLPPPPPSWSGRFPRSTSCSTPLDADAQAFCSCPQMIVCPLATSLSSSSGFQVPRTTCPRSLINGLARASCSIDDVIISLTFIVCVGTRRGSCSCSSPLLSNPTRSLLDMPPESGREVCVISRSHSSMPCPRPEPSPEPPLPPPPNLRIKSLPDGWLRTNMSSSSSSPAPNDSMDKFDERSNPEERFEPAWNWPSPVTNMSPINPCSPSSFIDSIVSEFICKMLVLDFSGDADNKRSCAETKLSSTRSSLYHSLLSRKSNESPVSRREYCSVSFVSKLCWRRLSSGREPFS